ncbi:DUF1294 domain-containing protein [Lactobacillus delbrueckii subsp. lactis DSM 20072]|uniref:DUF1294 domain-containing protein n=1 Tax=Lactobacillus delbrueckii TaxID=1584 RepID=UPI000202F37D|nr:DUF1294 domain-containing protein [Lactobacillus delbrueckii]ASW11438.1 DUF1294 domain-containing protein [Lactobacillus delbrueckii subsp. lactis DSM 20072]EGD26932.1 hypothetical protein HMPREF5505_1410 [Lactobacillus delbrueckii subsp. lactis DSM 20072]KRK64993.1 hypothetical protein FC10_GL001575 [Lactobacillus delbrueckii subsp. lactis DSM 20072]MCT3500472.1 DUF1294 domain-containing protein [Lactobacillus delbrueckii subsp. lactis]OOV10242.1 hypothetical protein LL072_07265 [Lactobaci
MNNFWQSSLLLINLIAFALYGIDKAKARMHAWRIPERLLLTCGLLAPAGSGLGMLAFHHKIRKPYFCLTVLASFILWAAIGYFIFSLN